MALVDALILFEKKFLCSRESHCIPCGEKSSEKELSLKHLKSFLISDMRVFLYTHIMCITYKVLRESRKNLQKTRSHVKNKVEIDFGCDWPIRKIFHLLIFWERKNEIVTFWVFWHKSLIVSSSPLSPSFNPSLNRVISSLSEFNILYLGEKRGQASLFKVEF